MEAWYSVVRQLKDDSEEPYFTEVFMHRVFHDLSRMRIKEKVKFREHMGPEYDHWVEELVQTYNPEFVGEILQDNEFWTLTLKMTRAA